MIRLRNLSAEMGKITGRNKAEGSEAIKLQLQQRYLKEGTILTCSETRLDIGNGSW